MTAVNECLILAAGNGSRIASVSGGVPKPLVRLRGIPLLEHVITSCLEAGITRFVIVVGYRADQIRHWFAERALSGIYVTLIENSEYHKANGVSALAAKTELHNPFLLLMSDHIFEPKTAKALAQQPLADDEVILAVDHNVDRVFDLDDATKVKCEADHIVDIGKDLARYDALDTGMFLCSPALFHRLESAKRDGNCSLSDGMRQLAREQKLRAFDIGDAHWQDVDSPEALAHAESIFDVDFPENPLAESWSMLRIPSKAQLPVRLIAIAMSAGFFLYLIWRSGPSKLWKSLSELGWGIILVIALAGVSHLARTWGWRLTLGDDQHKISFSRLVGLRLGAEAAGQLGILGQTLGDSVRVSRMSAEIPVASGLASVTFDRGLYVVTATV